MATDDKTQKCELEMGYQTTVVSLRLLLKKIGFTSNAMGWCTNDADASWVLKTVNIFRQLLSTVILYPGCSEGFIKYI